MDDRWPVPTGTPLQRIERESVSLPSGFLPTFADATVDRTPRRAGGQVWGSRDLQGDSVGDRLSDLLADFLAPLAVPSNRHRGDGRTYAPVPGIAATFIRFAADALGPGRTRTGEIPACRRGQLAWPPPFYALCDSPLSRHLHGPSRTDGRVRPALFRTLIVPPS
jgi:hypothetical protein